MLQKITQLLNDKRFVFIAIVLAVFLPYSNIFHNEFAYDDSDFFIDWNGIKSVNVGSFFSGALPINHLHAYRPLRSVIQAILYQVTSNQPFGYHIFSILVHLMSTLLVYFIVKKITHPHAAFASALIFAVLPVHVQSITFITASFDSIGVAFLLLSFYLYQKYQDTKKVNTLYASFIMAFAAYYTYELAIVLPLLIILYDLCIKNFGKKQLLAQIKYYAVFFIGSISLLFIKFFVIGPMYKRPMLTSIDFWSRMFTAAKAFVQYVYLVVVDYPLSIYYDIRISHALDGTVFASSLLILACIVFGVYAFLKNKKISTFIIFWFIISLLPVSNIIQIASFASDNYVYLASVAWAILAGIIFLKMYDYPGRRGKGMQMASVIFLLIVTLTYGYGTWARNRVWSNNEALWTTTLGQHPKYMKSYSNLSDYYMHKKMYAKAEEYAKKALEINPGYALAYENLGIIQMEQKKYDDAVGYFQKAIDINPDYAPSYHNLGFSYQELGKIGEAEKNYKKAIEILPSYFQSHKNLAVLYLSQERFRDALDEFARAESLDEGDYEIYFGLGMSYSGFGDIESAKKYYQKTIEMNPDFTPAREMLEKLK